MIDLCIADRFGKIYLLQHITKLELPCFRIHFITLSRFEGMMITLPGFLQLAENFFQAFFANALLCLRSYFYLPGLVLFGYISFLFQLINEIAHSIFVIR